MPNWCNNTVELAHEDPAMIKRAQEAFDRGEFLSEFIPVPQELKIVAGRVGDENDPAQIALEAAEKANQEKFGYTTWYDFCVNEWGTKWDVGMDGYPAELGEDGRLTLIFDSAWAPPVNAYEKLLDLGFSVRAYYYEPGMAFCGQWEDGDDQFYEIGGLRSGEVLDLIGVELDAMFDISETIANYEEEEEQEELHTWVVEGAEAKKAIDE
jgi:hypothetical protein